MVRAGARVAEAALGQPARVARWGFSTNGIATCGLHDIPTIGFGPGNEIHAHTTEDQVPIEHLVKAAQFYAMFPKMYLNEVAR